MRMGLAGATPSMIPTHELWRGRCNVQCRSTITDKENGNIRFRNTNINTLNLLNMRSLPHEFLNLLPFTSALYCSQVKSLHCMFAVHSCGKTLLCRWRGNETPCVNGQCKASSFPAPVAPNTQHRCCLFVSHPLWVGLLREGGWRGANSRCPKCYEIGESNGLEMAINTIAISHIIH